VGFCGETDGDFEASVDLLRRSRFKNSFIFKYSTRAGTKADALLADDVPEEVKRRRNNELLAVQAQVSETDNAAFVGRTVEILVDGPSKSAAAEGEEAEAGPIRQLAGRTACDRIVVFDGSTRLVGRFVRVAIEDVSAVTLFGRMETSDLVVLAT
jgi:tRNA-2-methylthio-N6-dimethylallyladenosine synthase